MCKRYYHYLYDQTSTIHIVHGLVRSASWLKLTTAASKQTWFVKPHRFQPRVKTTNCDDYVTIDQTIKK